MSAESIARWKAIPLNRPESEEAAYSSLKRPRDEGDDEQDDDVSVVSRTPSPPPPNSMDVDKYDEYYSSKPPPEVVTVETKIKSTNIGFSMLAKMGWVEGTPLGISGDGRVEPVPFYVKNDLTGLGKANQDVRMIESTVSQRRELDSERQTKETEEQRRQREDAVARRAAVQSEISSVLRPFYCEVCEKQFKNVAQYDEHTNSYAHHHKVRFRDMQLAQRASRNTEEEINKRKEKERKREEKELRKIAKAAGVKMAKPPVALAAVAETPAGSAAFGGGSKGGWATVTTSQPSSHLGSSKSGWAPVSAPNTPSVSAPRVDYTNAPSFRTGGWTSLETSNGVPPPHQSDPSSTASHSPAEVPSSRIDKSSHQGWANVSTQSGGGGWHAISSTSATLPPTGPSTLPNAVPAAPSQPIAPVAQATHTRHQEVTRKGWQNFRAGAPGRHR